MIALATDAALAAFAFAIQARVFLLRGFGLMAEHLPHFRQRGPLSDQDGGDVVPKVVKAHRPDLLPTEQDGVKPSFSPMPRPPVIHRRKIEGRLP